MSCACYVNFNIFSVLIIVYVEEPPIQPKTDDRKVAKGVLSERKVVDEEMKPALGSGQEKVYRKNEVSRFFCIVCVKCDYV